MFCELRSLENFQKVMISKTQDGQLTDHDIFFRIFGGLKKENPLKSIQKTHAEPHVVKKAKTTAVVQTFCSDKIIRLFTFDDLALFISQHTRLVHLAEKRLPNHLKSPPAHHLLLIVKAEGLQQK